MVTVIATMRCAMETPEPGIRLTLLRERLVKTGARLVRHARSTIFQLAEAALPRAVFAGVLDRINGLRGPPAEAACV
jgi:hypothetical protein